MEGTCFNLAGITSRPVAQLTEEYNAVRYGT